MTKVKQNDFTVDINEQVELVFNMIFPEQYEPLLKEMIRKEVIKKEDEIQKNYKDINRFMSDKFADKVYERLIKRVFFSNSTINRSVVTELVTEQNNIVTELVTEGNHSEEVLVAAKSKKKSN